MIRPGKAGRFAASSRVLAGFFFLLEHDIEELEHVCERMLAVASDQATAHRELISIHHRLELAEAETRKAQEQTRQSEEKLKRVLDHVPMQASLLTTGGEILWANRATLGFLRGKLEHVVGRSVWDRPPGFEVQPELKAEVQVMCERAARGMVCRTDLALRVPDTTIRILDLHIEPIRSISGAVEFRLPLPSTSLRESQQSRRFASSTRTSERRVAEQTSQLVAATAELTRAARLKDDFLANMATSCVHRSRVFSPCPSPFARECTGPLNQRQTQSVRDTEECGRHLLTLINDILDVAKIEAGSIELQEIGGRPRLCQAAIPPGQGSGSKQNDPGHAHC